MARDNNGIITSVFASSGDTQSPEAAGLTTAEGWPVQYSQPGGPKPQRTVFNFLYRALFALGVDVNKMGACLDWNASIAYNQYARVNGSDGVLYRAVQANTGNNPVGDDGTYWVTEGSAFPDLASQVEAETGTDNVNYMSPLRVAQARGATGQWSQNMAQNGYMVFPNGIIMQWGITGVINSTSFATVTFPLTYPNGAWIVTGCSVGDNAADAAGNNGGCTTFIVSTSQFTIGHFNTGSNNTPMFWISVGS